MTEITEEEWFQKVNASEDAFAVFLYTPFCGTCKLAGRMLEIASEALPGLPVYRCNLNFAPMAVSRWRIATVPCVLLFDKGQCTRRLNRIESADTVYRFLMQAKE